MRQNVKSVLLRLTEDEFSHLESLCQTTGLKREPLLRQLIMGVQLRPRPPGQYADLLRELSAIGRNVNQIAHWANAKKSISSRELQEAAALIHQAYALVKEVL